MRLRPLQVLRGVDGDPETLVPEAEELPLLGKVGERRLLVVAALGHPLERLLAEDVDTRVHPVRQPRRFAEAADAISFFEVHDPELRLERRDDDRRGAAVFLVGLEERPQVDVVQLVTVEGEDRPRLFAMLRGEPQSSPTPERLAFGDCDDLRAEP